MKIITIKVDGKVANTIKNGNDFDITLSEYDDEDIDEILDDFVAEYDLYDEMDFFDTPKKFVVEHKEELTPVFNLLAVDAVAFNDDEGKKESYDVEVLVDGTSVFKDTIKPEDYGF